MSITIRRDEFLQLIKDVRQIVPSRTTKDTLKNIRITVDHSQSVIRVLASNSEIHAWSSGELAAGAADESLDVLVEPGYLTGLLDKAREDDVTLKVDGGKLLIKCDGRASIPTADVADFIPLPIAGDHVDWVVDAREFHQAALRVIDATDVESTRYALGGVLFDRDGDHLVLVATDSRRLVVTQVATLDRGQPRPVTRPVVPVQAMKLVLGLADGQVKVAYSDNTIWFSGDRWSVVSRLVEGRFPEWRKVIPPKHEFATNINVSLINSLVARAAVFNEVESSGVDFKFSQGRVEIRSEHPTGKFDGSLPVDFDGRVDICFCSKLFERTVKPQVLGDTAEMLLIDGDSAVVLKSGGTTAVLMPLSRDR